MVHSAFWTAKRFLASQEIPHIVWNLKVHYPIYKGPLTVPVLSLNNPVHAPPSSLLLKDTF